MRDKQARHNTSDKSRGAPLWVRVVLVIGDFVVRRFYPRFVTGLEHYTASPATIVISNHRRDVDGPLLGSVLLRRRHGRLAAPLPNFVAREDLFDRGFLAHYLHHVPAVVRRVLSHLNLRGFLTRCGAYPLPRTHERSVAEVLRDLVDNLGDMPVRQAIRPNRMQALVDMLAFDPDATHISDLARGHNNRLWRARYGYRHLHLSVFRQLKPYLHIPIERQLNHFSNLLESGHMVILEPEGRLSLDGRLRRPRAALHEFINRTRRAVRVLPVAVTYDTLTTGQARIFVDIQPEWDDLRGVSRKAIDGRCVATIRAGCRVTAGQLAVGYFLFHAHTSDTWPATAAMNHVHDAAERCLTVGLSLDPCLLDRASCDKRTQDILAWAVDAGLLEHMNDQFCVENPDIPAPWLPDGPTTLLCYLRAELADTVGETRMLDLGLAP